MKKNRELFGYTVHDITRFTFLIMSLVNIVPLMHERYGHLMKFPLIFSLALLFYDIVNKSFDFKRYLRRKDTQIFLVFLCSYSISIILNRSHNFSNNISQIFYIIVYFYYFHLQSSFKNSGSVFLIIARIFLIFTFVYSLISFYYFLVSFTYYWNGPVTWLYLGMIDNRLWGLYNPNVGGLLNSLSIIFSFLLVYKSTGKTVKLFLVVNILLQYSCLLLTYSRTALYAFILSVSLLVFMLVLRDRSKGIGKVITLNNIKQLFISSLISVFVCGLLLISVNPFLRTLNYFPTIIPDSTHSKFRPGMEPIGPTSPEMPVIPDLEQPVSPPSNNQETENPIEESPTIPGREDEEHIKDDVLNGRGEIWKAGFKVFTDRPVFGVTKESIPLSIKPHLSEELYKNVQKGSLHNGYLVLLVSSGIIGSVSLLSGLLILLRKLFNCFNFNSNKDSISFYILISALILLLIGDVFEARLLFGFNVFGVIFWSITGELVLKVTEGE